MELGAYANSIYHLVKRFDREMYVDYIFYLVTRAYSQKFIKDTHGDIIPDVIMALVAWGPRHVGTFIRVGLPALLAPGNIPALAAGKKITMRVYTDAPSRALLEGTPLMGMLQRHIKVSYELVPQQLLEHPQVTTWERKELVARLFGGLVHVGIHEATAVKADLILVWPDQILGPTCYTYLRRLMQANTYDAMVVRAINVTRTGFIDALKPYYGANGILDLSVPCLASLAIRYMREESQYFFVRQLDMKVIKGFNYLIIPHARGLALRQANPDPVWISSRVLRQENDYDYNPPDDRLLTALFPQAGSWDRLAMPMTGDEYFVCDIADENSPEIEKFPRGDLRAELAINITRQWNDFQRTLFNQKTIIRSDDVEWIDRPEVSRIDTALDAAIRHHMRRYKLSRWLKKTLRAAARMLSSRGRREAKA